MREMDRHLKPIVGIARVLRSSDKSSQLTMRIETITLLLIVLDICTFVRLSPLQTHVRLSMMSLYVRSFEMAGGRQLTCHINDRENTDFL